MQGRCGNSVSQQMTWARNHVWPALFGCAGFPTGPACTAYWRPIRDHLGHVTEGRGGGARAHAAVVQTGAAEAQVAAGADEATAAAAGESGSAPLRCILA